MAQMPDHISLPVDVELESVSFPPVSLNINVDVNDLLDRYSAEEAYDMLGKLKDLFNA